MVPDDSNLKKGGVIMIRKILRVLLTLFGAAIGCAVCRIAGIFLERSGQNVLGMFTDAQIMGVYITFAIIFGIVFFRLTPVLMKQSNKVASNIENDLKGVSGSQIFAGVAGLIAGLVIAFFVSQMFRFIQDDLLYSIISIVIYVFLGYLGFVVATSKRNEIFPMLSASREQENTGQIRVVGGRKKKPETIPKILDTSVIIDGRVADIMSTGFMDGPVIIPEFVLVELRHIADSSDSLKRIRGRRGLDILKKIQTEFGVEIYNTDGEKSLKEIPEVDVKLIKLAQIMNGKVVTNDYNLNKVAAINGVEVLNINKLANCLKPVVLPGERMTIKLVKQGKDAGQAIGYLDDGTMIVAEDGRKHIGETVELTVTSVLQTSAGRMIFGRIGR
jgi:uncharacterized protein YacL